MIPPEDILHNGKLENLKNYKIFRKRAPSSFLSSLTSYTQALTLALKTNELDSPVLLKNWHFKLIPNPNPNPNTPLELWIVLCGTLLSNTTIQSSFVVDVTGSIVKTENSVYLLDGECDALCMPHEDFDKKLCGVFANGFPYNWKELITTEVERIINSNNNKVSAKSEVPKNKTPTKKAIKHVSSKNNKNIKKTPQKSPVTQDLDINKEIEDLMNLRNKEDISPRIVIKKEEEVVPSPDKDDALKPGRITVKDYLNNTFKRPSVVDKPKDVKENTINQLLKDDCDTTEGNCTDETKNVKKRKKRSSFRVPKALRFTKQIDMNQRVSRSGRTIKDDDV